MTKHYWLDPLGRQVTESDDDDGLGAGQVVSCPGKTWTVWSRLAADVLGAAVWVWGFGDDNLPMRQTQRRDGIGAEQHPRIAQGDTGNPGSSSRVSSADNQYR